VAGLKRPVSQAGPDVKKIVSQINKAVPEGMEGVVRKAAAKAKDIQDAELRKATSTMRLRNVGPRGARVSITTKVKRKGYAMAEGEVSARGPVHLLERRSGEGTNGYEIIAGFKGDRNSIRQNNSGAEALTVPGKGRGFFSRVVHPGAFHASTPKMPFQKGYDKSRPHIKKIMRREVFTIVKDNYKL
jgi:hypothetical protein